MMDPELQALKFYGMMRAPFNVDAFDSMDATDPDPWDSYRAPCKSCGEKRNAKAFCQTPGCHKEICWNCGYSTGIADGYRCGECEQISLERLERAVRNIGSLPYQNALAEALMMEGGL